MLKYVINQKNLDKDIVDINIFSYNINEIVGDDVNLGVTFVTSDDILVCEPHDEVRCTVTNSYTNDDETDDSLDDILETQTVNSRVVSVNSEKKSFIIFAPKYREIKITSVEETIDDDNIVWWEFYFEDGHYFRNDGYGIELKLYYNRNDYDFVELTNLEYVNCRVLQWRYDENVENIKRISDIFFPLAVSTFVSNDDILIDKLITKRTQTFFNVDYTFENPTRLTVELTKNKNTILLPLYSTYNFSLLTQNQIDNTFIETESNKTIPSFNEMEKVVYTPVIRDGDSYRNVRKINFNLHFREHSDENWTVKNTDEWNFCKNQPTTVYDYYSYNNESNQSDLLSYLGFTTKDVRFQKNVLKKSFLRLQYFDSPSQVNQNLLGYSTIFFNTGNLYAKYMKCQNINNLYAKNGNMTTMFNNINVDREVRKTELSKLVKTLTDDTVESFRLSSQMSVSDKYSSIISSEGFYVYLWADNNTNIPETLYMSVEFNHAGYGRTIPMMMPYFIDGVDDLTNKTSLIKTNADIIKDWQGDGYGIKKYQLYSYIKLKYLYNEENRYVYYLDSDTYGTYYDDTDVLNINLYEARITF